MIYVFFFLPQPRNFLLSPPAPSSGGAGTRLSESAPTSSICSAVGIIETIQKKKKQQPEIVDLGEACQRSGLPLGRIDRVPLSLEGCGRLDGVNKLLLCLTAGVYTRKMGFGVHPGARLPPRPRLFVLGDRDVFRNRLKYTVKRTKLVNKRTKPAASGGFVFAACKGKPYNFSGQNWL